MAASAERMIQLGMVPPLAAEVAAQISDNLPVEPGSIVNADINAAAAIALTKLGTGALPTSITIVNANVHASAGIASTKLAAAADVAALTAARAAPATYSETGEDIAAVLVALGVMAAE